MTIAIVQSAAATMDTSLNATNIAKAFTSNVTAGNILVCWFSTRSADPDILSVQDSQTNTWTKRNKSYSDRGVACWTAVAGSSAACTVTVNKNADSCGLGFSIYELSGVTNISGIFDATDAVAQSVDTGPAQATTGSNAYNLDLIMFGIGVEQAAYVTCTPLSGYTDSGQSSTNTTIALQHRVITQQTSITQAWLGGWTLTAASHWSVLGVIFRGATTAPTITGISTSTPVYLGSLTITGVNFGTSTGTVTIGGASCAVTAWSDTSITCTVARGTNAYGVAVNVQITTSGSVASNAFSASGGLVPQTGWSYVNLGTPNVTAANRITAVTDLASGDQLAYNSLSGTVTVATDATWVEFGTSNFSVEAWTTGSGWGTPGTQSFAAPSVAVLSAAGSNTIGVTTANAIVTTDTSGGTLYVVATTNNAQPTNTQIKAGQDSTGTASPHANQAALSGINTLPLTGLTGATTYYLWFVQNTLGGDSNVVTASFVTASLPTPPVLSSPGTGSSDTNSAHVKVTTDTAGGILYVVACINPSPPSIAQIKNGQDGTGTATPSVNTGTVTVGVNVLVVTGLTSGTTYRVFYLQELPGPSDSNIVHNNITTAATTPTLSGPGSDTITNISANADVSTDTAGGTLYVVASTLNVTPTTTQIKQGQDSTGALVPSATNTPVLGANQLGLTGLTINTPYFCFFVQNNASGDSNIVTTGFTTTNITTPAVLSSPNTTNIAQTSVDALVTTNTAGGTIYVVATLTNAQPSNAQIKAGQNAAGVTSPSRSATATVGVNDLLISGLTASTIYYLWFIQNTGVDSNVIGLSFTTASAAPPPPPPAPSPPPTYPTSGTVGQSRIQVIRYIEHAVRRCGALPNILSAEQLIFARENLGFILTDFSTKGLTAWTFEKQVQGLSVGQVRYHLNNGTFQKVNILRRNATYNPVVVSSDTSTCTLTNTDTIAIYSTDVLLTSGGYFDFILEYSADGATYYQAGRQAATFIAGQRVCVESEITAPATYWRLRENTNSSTFGFGFFLSNVTEVPMGQLNRSDYTNLPDKGQLTTDPTTYFLDMGTDTVDVVLWQAPQTSFRQLVAWVQRYVQDVGDFVDYLEVPQRWQDAIIFELATRIFLELPKSVTDNLDPNRLQYLEGKALAKLTEALSGESDGAPLRLTPRIAPYTRS